MQAATVAGVRLTHPDKVLYAGQGATKLELAQYLDGVANRMLPYVADRPLSLVRCPRGSASKCFFQRHHQAGLPAAIRSFKLAGFGARDAELLYLRDARGLVSGAQMNVLEYHIWGARRDRPERPDRLVLDLDPSPEVEFIEVKRTACEIREALAGVRLQSFLLLTGGKGVHLVTPLQRRHDWSEVTESARSFAQAMAAAAPERWVATSALRARTGKIYLDWRRNERGSTAIAPFSPRAREGAPVAVPISWDELDGISGADVYGIRTLPRRLQSLRRDPWDGFFDLRQYLSAAVQRAIHAM